MKGKARPFFFLISRNHSRPNPNWIWQAQRGEHTDTETCAVGVASIIFHLTQPPILYKYIARQNMDILEINKSGGGGRGL